MHDLKTHWFSNVLNNFKCDLSAKEKELLKRVGRDVSIGCIVAIGPNSRNIETELSCVNTEDGKDYNKLKVFYFEQKMYSKSDRDLYYQGESFDTPHCISRIILSSEEATFFWREPIGMLFLSGDHSYDQLKRDIDQWEPFVVPSGLIVIHEGKKGGDDTRNVIEEVISTKKYIRYDNIGKTNVLKKVFVTHPNDIPPLPRMRLLIACNDMVPAGGLLRFQRAGSVMERWGHKVCFVVLSDAPKPKIKSEFPVISFERAKKLEWDAVMVPGAGFTVRSREKLADLKKENFGVRIQHILNDQSRLERFKLINEIFSPNIVIFNNTHWPIGSFTRFRADRFHFLIGAVDPRVFRPMTYRTHPLTPKCWVVGGLAPKNPDPLVESLAHLPETVCIRMFGIDRLKISQRYKKYFNQGRLELVGILNEQELQNFYHAADCIVMTEKNAGWANMVAEAMASGVPVICTPHG